MVGIKTRVTCPKCGQSFDYEFIPGGSFNAIRLGKYRYMKCQICGKWALFDIVDSLSQDQRTSLSNSGIIAGIALAVLGGVIFAIATTHHITPLYISGIIVLATALFMIGYSQTMKKGKS